MSATVSVTPNTILISADSHMGEPPDLWEKNLPEKFKDHAPRWPHVRLYETMHHMRAGAWDPHERLKDQAVAGVSAEVLFPTLAHRAWLMDDQELEEASIRVYNEWMADFCKVNPERFWGLGMLPLRNPQKTEEELKFCKDAGLKGGLIWIAPPVDLQYSDAHYERLWAVAQDLDMSLSMHINARAEARGLYDGVFQQLHSVNGHKFEAMTALVHIIASGVLDRYPRLKIAVSEVGVGWVPYWLQEFDYYTAARSSLPQPPSEYFRRQVYSAFISDTVGARLIEDYPDYNSMWSNDYPHPACIWPDAAEDVAEELSHLPADLLEEVVCNTAAKLYNGGKIPSPVGERDGDYLASVRSWTDEHPEWGETARTKNAPQAGKAVRAF